MAEVFLKENKLNTIGDLPKVGSKALDFSLTTIDLTDKKLSDFIGKKIILNIFPSIDTETCASSVRHFNKEASELKNTVVLCISKDLPFAQKRFCGAEGLENVITLSQYKNNSFSDNYKVEFIDGPLVSLFSRAVIVIDEQRNVIYTEQVENIVNEPNYEQIKKIIN